MPNIELLGATYPDVPAVELPKSGGGTARFENATWFGSLEYEFLREEQWSAKLNEADNWPLTATTTAQPLKWKTTHTSTANQNATYARYGKGYNGEQLDFGTYNYVFLIDAMTHVAYTSEESTLGKIHVIANAGESARNWGARPRTSSGAIIYPTASAYGAYAAVANTVNMCYYRNASNQVVLANNSTYGVSIAIVDESMNSTSKVNPDYFNIRIPTFGIRAHDTYMPVASFSDIDATKTVLAVRTRIYRVPVEQGIYHTMNIRMLDDMILGNRWPEETE